MIHLTQKRSAIRSSHADTTTENGRLHVAHVSNCLEVGGAENLMVEFARYLDRDRFDLSFVSLSGDGPVGKLLREAGRSVATLQRPDGVSPRLVFRLARHFRRNRVDIVHTHDMRPYVHATIAARMAGVKQVVHTRHCQTDFLSPLLTRFTNFIGRWTDHFVCVSHEATRYAIERGMASQRVRTIWNGVDLSRFRFRLPNADDPLVTVARLSPEKDQATLLRAIAIAARQDPALQVQIAGDGPCRSELEDLAVELNIHDRVRFLGNVNDIPALLAGASLFALSSKTEGIALTILEAQAQGLPVIATRVGGNPEVIVDGETGVLVPDSDPESLADAILTLRRDRELCVRLGHAARARIEQCFDVQQMVQNYESLYTKCHR